jgi:uncharacterized protein (DUF58 family)
MPYTYKSLAFAWLIILALFVASASGVAQGGWLVLLIAVAFVVPALVLRSPVHVATAIERPSIPAEERKRSPLDSDRVVRAIEHTRGLPA